MEHVKRLKVSLQLEGEYWHVGELLQEQRIIYFKYHPDFLQRGLLLSPFKLPVTREVLQANTTVFGVINPKVIIEQVKEVLSNWRTYAKAVDLSISSQKRVEQVINQQLKR